MKENPIKKLCLGTVQFGLDYGLVNRSGKPSKKEAFNILNCAHDAGIETLDTAYSYGDSEELIGEFIAKTGKEFNIISKTPHFGKKSADLRDNLSETLRRLGQESIYGYLLHDFNDIHPIPGHREGLWAEMEGLRDAGAERIGLSLYKTEELKYLIDNEVEFDIIQAPFNILDQRFKDYFKILEDMHAEVYARSIFLQGLFFEKRDKIKKNFGNAWDSLSRIDEVSKKYRIPVNALCLSFAMLNDSIDKVIIGVDSLKQLKENLDSLKYLDRVKAVYDQLGSLNLDDEDIILPVNWDRSSKASVIIQARMGATRLPGKVLMKVLDKTILEHVIERVKRSRRIDNVIVATTTKSEDKPVAELMKKCGVEVFRGSEEDVLDRFYQAAKKHNIKHIVRITADCPLIDPRIIDTAIARYFNSGADYCSNVWDRTYPDGEDVEVFNFKSLESAWKKARLLSEREHVTPFMTNNRKDFKIVQFKQGIDLSKKRWSLDRKDDYKFIKAVLEGIYPDNPDFHIGDVVKFLESNPGVEDLNKSHIINEGYQKSLREDRIITRRRRKKE